MHYRLKLLNILKQNIATIASNPDQLLPRPQTVAYPCLFWMPNISCEVCIKRCANPFAIARGWQMPARWSPKSTMICAICWIIYLNYRRLPRKPQYASGDFAKLTSGRRQSAQMGVAPDPMERKSRYLAILR